MKAPIPPLATPQAPIAAHAADQPILHRFNVRVLGKAGGPVLLFCNGFNCNQQVWHYLTPALAPHYQLVFFDQMGTGQSDLTAYDAAKYASFGGYAQDIVAICRALGLRDVTLVGHSAGAMMALLATITAPTYFARAVLLAVSPHYLNEPDYYGGFERKDVEDLLAALDGNYQNWANTFATMLMGQDNPPALGYELAGYFCQTDPTIARQVVHLTMYGDNRADLPQLRIPTLLLQCADDVAVPAEVNAYLAEHLPQARLVVLDVSGHCPHLSAPRQVVAAMQEFLNEQPGPAKTVRQ